MNVCFFSCCLIRQLRKPLVGFSVLVCFPNKNVMMIYGCGIEVQLSSPSSAEHSDSDVKEVRRLAYALVLCAQSGRDEKLNPEPSFQVQTARTANVRTTYSMQCIVEQTCWWSKREDLTWMGISVLIHSCSAGRYGIVAYLLVYAVNLSLLFHCWQVGGESELETVCLRRLLESFGLLPTLVFTRQGCWTTDGLLLPVLALTAARLHVI